MSNNSRELEVTGAIMFVLGGIFLISPISLTTISNVTTISIESVVILCYVGIFGGLLSSYLELDLGKNPARKPNKKPTEPTINKCNSVKLI